MPAVTADGTPVNVALARISAAQAAAHPASSSSPPSSVLSHLTRAGDSATVNVSVGGKRNVSGVDVDAKATASIQTTLNADGSYNITLTRSGELNGTVSAGGNDDANSPEKKSMAIKIVGGLVGTGGDDQPGATRPKVPSIVSPVVGPGGIAGLTVVPGEGTVGKTKPPEGGNGSGSQAGVVTTPGESNVTTSPSAQASAGVGVSYSVTVHAQSGVAAETIDALAHLAASPNTLSGSLTDNPIMDQIHSGNVSGVSPSTLATLEKNVQSYSETLTGKASAMSGFETSFGKDDLTKVGVGAQSQSQVSITRTVNRGTFQQQPGKPGDLSSLSSALNPPKPVNWSVAYGLSVQSGGGPELKALGSAVNPSSSAQTSLTKTWNLNTLDEVSNPENALSRTPDQIDQQFQTQTTSGGPASPIFGNSTVYTDTRTHSTNNDTHTNTSSDSKSTTLNSTINVGGDGLISASATLSQPIFP
jgi:hypothetical protein